MVGPVLRLLAIYVCVGLAVFGFLKRDRIMGLFSGPEMPSSVAPAPAGATSTAAVLQTPGAPQSAPAMPAGSGAHEASGVPAAPAAPAASGLQVPAAPGAAVPAPQAAATQSGAGSERHFEARRTYWDGEASAAIALYKELLKADPDNLELNGELGNIYYMAGNHQKAAQYYRKAGETALKERNKPQLQQLVSILRPLDAAGAGKLEQGLETLR